MPSSTRIVGHEHDLHVVIPPSTSQARAPPSRVPNTTPTTPGTAQSAFVVPGSIAPPLHPTPDHAHPLFHILDTIGHSHALFQMFEATSGLDTVGHSHALFQILDTVGHSHALVHRGDPASPVDASGSPTMPKPSARAARRGNTLLRSTDTDEQSETARDAGALEDVPSSGAPSHSVAAAEEPSSDGRRNSLIGQDGREPSDVGADTVNEA